MNEVDELLLEHYGKKGMHWGQRTSAARAENKAKNKASRAADRQKHKTTVERARANIDSGKTDAALKKARQAHAANKAALGSREARKILNQAKDKSYREYVTADQAKDGKEATKIILASAAVGVGAYILARSITRGAF